MVKSINEAQQIERDIFSEHIAKCNSFYCGIVLSLYISSIFFMIRFPGLPIPDTTNVEYPCQVNHAPINIIIYLHTYIVCYTSFFFY